MSGVVNTVEDVALVKSNALPLPQDRSAKANNGSSRVDLHRGVRGNGKFVLSDIGCPETNGSVFPIECLEGAMRAMTEAVSRQQRNPHGLAGACVIGIVSAAIGKGLKTPSHPNKTCPGNVYILVGTPSGQGKSETLHPILKPLHQYEAELTENWTRNTKPNLEAQERRFKRVIKGLERQLASPKCKGDPKAIQDQLEEAFRSLDPIAKKLLASPYLIIENATSEATAKLLSLHGECLASISSDAREVIAILSGKYTDGKTDESVFIKGFGWEEYISHRITRDPVSLREPCLTCIWLVQPDKIADVFALRSLTEGGLLPRFLLLMADYEPQPIDRSIPGLSREIEADWDSLIRDLLEIYRFATTPFMLSPTQEAITLLDNHCNAIIEARKSTLREITTFAARWNEQAWRLAVVLHAGRYGKEAHKHAVDVQTAQSAIKLVDWFAEHQKWILNKSDLLAFSKISHRVVALCRTQPDGVTASDLYRQHIVADAEAAHALLKRMQESDLLDCDERPTPGGGHPMRTYRERIPTPQQ
jgi:hypothetical protein